MVIKRVLGRLATIAMLVIGLAGCAQNDMYGTIDTGVGYRHTSAP